tara:strand:- start:905 stop:1615 length:711 start_codon:yes stop_codon:yes gene_type:complete
MAESNQQSASPTSNPDRWLLKYGERVYGPYSHDAMVGYIAEGRVIASSMIAPEGTAAEASGWLPAISVPTLAANFASPAPTADETRRVVPTYVATAATASDQQVEESALIQQATPPQTTAETTGSSRPAYGPAKGQIDRRRQPETANFIVIMDIKARYAGQLEQAIMSLGPAYKLAPNVWCVNTDSSAAGLLNDLSIHIGKTDSMFIVDATRDRTAWHNLGPETDAKIRRVWRRAF